MKRTLRIMTIILALCITFPMVSKASNNSYSERPTFSVLGDSISTYYRFHESIIYYGPEGSGCPYIMNEEDTYWRRVCDDNGGEIGWNSAIGMARAAIDDNEFISIGFSERVANISKNGIPDYVIVYGGSCDVTADKTSPADFYTGYKRVVDKIHRTYPDTKLIQIGLGYFIPEYHDSEGTAEDIDGYNDAIRRIAEEYGDYYVDLRGVLNDKKYFDSGYSHPNEEGMALIAKTIEESIRNARGEVGIETISANPDYYDKQYIFKVTAFAPDYDSINFKFNLVNNNTGEVIHDTDYQKDNCFLLNNVDSNATYTATAEIDNNGDGIADATMTRSFSNLVIKDVTTVYNGVDYSSVYDFNNYIRINPDLYIPFHNDPAGALEHFVNFGMNEARTAKNSFDMKSYRNRYPDLRAAFGWNNTRAYYNHYMSNGIHEGRIATGCEYVVNPVHTFLGTDFSVVYNYEFYNNNYEDLKEAFGGDDAALFNHYLYNGLHEGRQASPNFNLWTYIGNYEDLRNAFGFNLPAYVIHYINYGQYEGRTAL